MTEQLKYRAKINAKGLDTTGVTEDHARRMASTLGSHHLFLVEGRAATVLTDEAGNQQVAIILTQVEPVPAAQEDTVREFMRALYRARPEQQGQAVLTGAIDGPSVKDAETALSAQIDRGPDGEPEVWDGDTDAPLAGPGQEPEEEADLCAFPGCTLLEDHPGDHNTEQEEGEDAGETTPAAVPLFSGKGRRG